MESSLLSHSLGPIYEPKGSFLLFIAGKCDWAANDQISLTKDQVKGGSP